MSLLSSVAEAQNTPVDRWLAEQSNLSAVERFSQRHDAHAGPVQERYYRDLLPAAPLESGQQLAFAVDLDACTGCKACVAACHSLNGLDDNEQWRKVSRIDGVRDNGLAFQQTVTAACHHCVDPACMKGCPVDAYEKDPVTGIVRHLDDQCIGCSYCTLTCPYEVPSFNQRLGIVRKCDMCSDRLAESEAPACVQSCPNEAISITIIDVAAVVGGKSTTQYKSSRDVTPAMATDSSRVGGQAQAHPPLAVMLVLTQLSVGAFVTELALRWFGSRNSGNVPAFDAMLIAAVGVLALGASVLHLGRPLYAHRAVIGLRHSWLSREIVAFGAFTGLAVPYAVAVWSGAAVEWLGIAAAIAGVGGVACSVLIYTTTRRRSWRPLSVTIRFFGGAAIAGATTVAWTTAVRVGSWPEVAGMTLVLAAVVAGQLYERHLFFTRASRPE